MRQLFLEALASKNRARPPVWIMRQAGRYMPSYQKLRERYGLIEMFTHSALIEEVTLQPIDAFDMDAAIVFSDILLVLRAMGLEVNYSQGVAIGSPLTSFTDPRLDIDTLSLEAKMSYLRESILSLKKRLKVPLIGFVSAPWTLACYAYGSKEGASLLREAFWKESQAGVKMLAKLQNILIELALIQIRAGVDVIQIFDSHSNWLSPYEYREWVVKPVSEMIKTIGERVPVIYFTRASSLFMEELIKLPNCCLSIDWQSSVERFRDKTNRSLQGAFNPYELLSSPSNWKPRLREELKLRANDRAYICNLGHGVLPMTPVEHIREFVEEVKYGNWYQADSKG